MAFHLQLERKPGLSLACSLDPAFWRVPHTRAASSHSELLHALCPPRQMRVARANSCFKVQLRGAPPCAFQGPPKQSEELLPPPLSPYLTVILHVSASPRGLEGAGKAFILAAREVSIGRGVW